MILLAHSARNEQPPQPYRDHVAGVVHLACINVNRIVPYVDKKKAECYFGIVNDAAVYHDLGKLAAGNQEVLAARKKSTGLDIEHRDAGVKYLIGSDKERPTATLVYAHHRPGLPNLVVEKNKSNPFRFFEAMTDTEAHIREYIALHNEETCCLATQQCTDSMPRLSAMEYRMLLSCLVDADYSNTAGENLAAPETRWKERLVKLDEYVRNLQSDSDNVSPKRKQMRKELYDCCRNAFITEPLVYCDSPVGTGKTTAVMAYMLWLAAEKHLRHIFVILPYTNIISQTVKVLRKALVLDGENPQEIIAEHHHQADFESIELRHLASTWTAPIIVTTAVQFFETLAASQPSKLRKLHQLPGSGIIVDESHASLPIRLMPQAWKWITELTNKWGCRFCLCSGTSFKFWENPGFTKISYAQVFPLITRDFSKKLEKFERDRVRLEVLGQSVPHFMNASECVNYLDRFHGSRLVVFNTVRSAALFAKILRDRGYDVLHLSTALTPDDRESVIHEVKQRLDNRSNYIRSWTLVATSCIECGMDFSFHYGFCELCSLESYYQLGGRISRNDEYEDGTLTCFTITADGFGIHPDFEIAREVFTKQIHSGRLSDLTITDAVSESFDMQIKSMGGLSDEICKLDRGRNFADVAKKFRVISDDTITVIAKPELIEKLHAGKSVTAQELQRGSVCLRKSTLEQLQIKDMELPLLTNEQYDNFLGYMKSLV